MNRNKKLLAGSIVVLLAAASAVQAATLQWDSNGATAGTSDAAGNWNNAGLWWDGSNNVNWVQNSDAQFGAGTLGNAGNVTISGTDPIVNSITFNNDFGAGNFNITGGTVKLANTSTNITVNSASSNAQISSILAGVGLGINKQGAAELRLNGSVTYTGATTITAGTVRVNSAANNLYTNTSGFFMAGGNLVVFAGASQNIAKDFTFSSAGSGNITTFDAAGGHTLSGLMTINPGANFNIRPRNVGVTNFEVTGQITGSGNFAVANGSGDAATAAVRLSNTANNYGGSTTITGGRLILGASDVIPNGSTVTMNLAGANVPTLDLNGFSETINGLSSTAAGALVYNNSGAGTSVLTVGSAGASSSYAGVIQNNNGVGGGAVALTKIGAGTLTLSNANTYTGGTLVNGGTLSLGAGGSLTSNVTVNTGGAFTGSGSVNSLSINAGGFHAPGNSPGIDIINGNYTMAGTLTMDIDGLAGAGLVGGHDLIDVNGGGVNLSGTLLLNSGILSSYLNQSWVLIDNDGVDAIVGTFSGWANNTEKQFGYYYFTIDYFYNAGNDGQFNDVRVTLTSLVPEPSSYALLALGALLIGPALRRKRQLRKLS